MDKKQRSIVISEVLNDLQSFSVRSDRETYSVQENITFFKSLRSLRSYLNWFFFHAPKIDSTKLLEINDLLPKWDSSMHEKLLEMERRDFPGLIKPIVQRLAEYIRQNIQSRDLVLCSLGSGSMELERQMLLTLDLKKLPNRITILAIDSSPHAHNVARENLTIVSDYVNQIVVNGISTLNLNEINRLSPKKVTVVYLRSDVFDLEDIDIWNSFDISYSSLFKHHLIQSDQTRLMEMGCKLSRTYLEYDGFKSWIAMIPQTIIGWNHPVFLNAEIFSNLRFSSKKSIRNRSEQDKPKISFYFAGYYMLEYTQS